MSKNRNALARYKAIDALMADGSGHSIAQMQDACKSAQAIEDGDNAPVSRVTIYADLKAMEEIYGVSFSKSEGHPVLYSYSEGSKTMNGSVVANDNYREIIDALTYLEGVSGLVTVNRTINSLSKKLDISVDGRKIIDFEHNPNLKNGDKLWTYYKYIRENKPMLILYSRRYNPAEEVDIQPYYLKQYNNRWFLMAWSYTEGRIGNFAIDRIESFSYNRSRAMSGQVRACEEDFEQMFKDRIGVTRYKTETEPSHILLRADLTDPSGLYDFNRIETKPLHPSQTSEKTETEGLIHITIFPNPEFYSVISGYTGIEIVEPSEVREEFIKRMKNILAHYEG